MKKPAKARKRTVNARQARFVQEYIKDMNGGAAYLRAGYRVSESVARVNAAKLLTKSNILDAVNFALGRALQKLEITNESILSELARLAFANMYDFIKIQPDGSVICDFSNLTREQAAAISEINYDQTVEATEDGIKPVRRIKFKLCKKIAALELLARYRKLFSDTMQPPMSRRAKAIMKRYRAGELDAREVGCMFAEMAESLPEVVRIDLQKAKPEPTPPEAPPALDDAELEAEYRKAMGKVDDEINQFVPQRREEVKKIKDDLKGADSFNPDQGAR